MAHPTQFFGGDDVQSTLAETDADAESPAPGAVSAPTAGDGARQGATVAGVGGGDAFDRAGLGRVPSGAQSFDANTFFALGTGMVEEEGAPVTRASNDESAGVVNGNRMLIDNESVDSNASTRTNLDQRLREETRAPDRGSHDFAEAEVPPPPFHLEGDQLLPVSTPTAISSPPPHERAHRSGVLRFDQLAGADVPPDDRDDRPYRPFARSVPEPLGRAADRPLDNSSLGVSHFGYGPSLTISSLFVKSNR